MGDERQTGWTESAMMTRKEKTDTVFTLDAASETPKYKQIMAGVGEAIRTGRLQKGDALPSINEAASIHSLARDTVVKAYNRLKEMGLLESAHGKGFRIATDHYSTAVRVFVLFDTFTPYKETLYEAMRAAAGGQVEFDIYFHHFNPAVFVKLLTGARGKYSMFVVMPFPDPAVREALAGWDQDKLLLLDIDVDYFGRRCAAVLQDHDTELERALEAASDRILTYKSCVLVFPEDKHHPQCIKPAVRRFCRRHGIEHRIVQTLREETIAAGHVYFVIEDTDLVALVKAAQKGRLKIGKEVGILSYNDTPMKEVVLHGISVVSVDFAEMGRQAVAQILSPKTLSEILEPTRFIARHSL
jgi:DNA-binding transcriptional regulator YhcF (GntR family)